MEVDQVQRLHGQGSHSRARKGRGGGRTHGRVHLVSASPDGRWLATGSGDWKTRLYLLPLDELKDMACHSAGRNLTEAELQQYFPGEDYRPTCPENP